VSGPLTSAKNLSWNQPPHLDTGAGFARQQAQVAQLTAADLVEELGDDGGARDRRMPLGHQHRGGAGGIEHEEILAPLPDPLLDGARGEPVLADREPHEARMRAERMMEQRQHAR
jgi:hypothetical protein